MGLCGSRPSRDLRLVSSCSAARTIPTPSPTGTRRSYTPFNEAPKTLDPAVAYTTAEHVVTGTVFDTLLECHFLKRPYELIPSLAEAIPQAEPQPNGQIIYRFRLRPGVLFHADPCFALNLQGKDTREVLASDVASSWRGWPIRQSNSPVASTFGDVLGFTEFSKRLVERRKADATFAALPAHEQYKQAGGIEGVVGRGDGAGWRTFPIPKTSSSCSSAATRNPRIEGPTRPISATRATTSSIVR